MKTEQIHSLTETFEGHALQTESGVEYWLTRYVCYFIAQNYFTIQKSGKTVQRFRECLSALATAVMMGKIDVRNLVKPC